MSERSDTDAGRDLQLGKVLFIGDSIIQGGAWAEWLTASTVVDEGVGGATTADVVARLPELIEQAPDTVVVLVGTNDLAWHRTTEHVVRNIETIVATFRRDLPDIRILVISVLPRGHEFAPQIREINRHLWQFAPTAHAGYLDLWPVLAGEDGGSFPSTRRTGCTSPRAATGRGARPSGRHWTPSCACRRARGRSRCPSTSSRAPRRRELRAR